MLANGKASVSLLVLNANSPSAVPPVAALAENKRPTLTPAVYPDGLLSEDSNETYPFLPFGRGAVIIGAEVYPEPPSIITTLAVVEDMTS